jgi:hypothetical protein
LVRLQLDIAALATIPDGSGFQGMGPSRETIEDEGPVAISPRDMQSA